MEGRKCLGSRGGKQAISGVPLGEEGGVIFQFVHINSLLSSSEEAMKRRRKRGSSEDS